MTTVLALASKLSVSARTIRDYRKKGYELEMLDSKRIDVDKSVQKFVKFLMESARQSAAKKGREESEKKGNSNVTETVTNWKEEKEKQSALKIKLSNDITMGKLVPADALFELYNEPLSWVRNQLIGFSNQISKRMPLSQVDKKMIDDLAFTALNRLNEKGVDELQLIITPIIARYSEYYSATEEGTDNSMGDG